jgi:hypothetical protein
MVPAAQFHRASPLASLESGSKSDGKLQRDDD